jgi:hypothetical protein
MKVFQKPNMTEGSKIRDNFSRFKLTTIRIFLIKIHIYLHNSAIFNSNVFVPRGRLFAILKEVGVHCAKGGWQI